jgi:erythritol kinase (D-erythritol 1-phosphate-forming)
MAHHAEILLGLEAGTARLVAAAFTADGHEIARAARANPIERSADGTAEQSPGETWQRAAAVLRQLGRQVPGLARRTLALALTGPAGGSWLCDEDGDAVTSAILPLDRRAEALVARWHSTGLAGEVAGTTGCPPDASSQSAQLAWLAVHRPAALDQAASVFCGKDWLYFCLSGERASEATAALAAFGSLATGAYDAGLLERLGLHDLTRLLPGIVDGTRHQGALAPAAAAATGLVAGTPVVLGPVDSVARSLAAGLGAGAGGLGASDAGPGGLHVRSCRRRPQRLWPERGVAIRRFAGLWFALATQPASLGPDWLIGLAEQLLADAGLIGVPRGELCALLERKAAAAPAGSVRCERGAGASPGWSLSGLAGATTFYDLLRATHEAVGREARACYAALDHRPREVRIVGAPAPGAGALEMLGAGLGARVRPLLRAAPAATGAALTAALSLGVYPDLAAADADWVTPHLGPPLAAAA